MIRICCVFVVLFVLNGPGALSAQLVNRLAEHESPYLAMHGNDPVAWQEWNELTVKQAQQENKLLFVSSGYFSCHWCHVMQRESFSNQEIASLLNQNFIPVKVDRELNASLDTRLIDFVEKTRGYAGWPLNVLITPAGYPLVGIVYLPKDDFRSLLTNMHSEWQGRAGELKNLARQASRELNVQVTPSSTVIDKQFVNELTARFTHEALSQADEMQGGFGQQSKFPMVPQLEALLAIYEQDRDSNLGEFLQLTLDMMASQGMRDQLGGGFFRYAVDPGWQIPHFEKMLYDNAQLASLYLEAARIFKRPDYESIGRETLDFMLDKMRDSSGAFIASLSAIDSNNVEGGYYLWQPQHLEKILTQDENAIASEIWKVQGAEDIEGGHHLVTASSLEQLAKKLNRPYAEVKEDFRRARIKMLKAREQRHLPLDNKKIAAWNGLALSALVSGSRLKLGYQRYEMAATQLRDYILRHFWVNQRLYRAVQGNAFGDPGLEDAAYLLKGLLDYQQYLGSGGDNIRQLHDTSWKLYFQQQGWQINARPLLKYQQYSLLVQDGPMPSAAAVLLQSSARLGAKDFASSDSQVGQHLSLIARQVAEQPFWYASYVKLFRQLD